jgi:hypothetical protein
MMLPIVILLPWLSTLVLVLAACRGARIGDAQRVALEPPPEARTLGPTEVRIGG